MKIYLDDERTPPAGWTLVRWPAEAIELLSSNDVTHLSLDHDLGEVDLILKVGRPGNAFTGMEVLDWLEEQIFHGAWTKPLPVITIHSANPVAQQRMNQALTKIQQMYQLQQD